MDLNHRHLVGNSLLRELNSLPLNHTRSCILSQAQNVTGFDIFLFWWEFQQFIQTSWPSHLSVSHRWRSFVSFTPVQESSKIQTGFTVLSDFKWTLWGREGSNLQMAVGIAFLLPNLTLYKLNFFCVQLPLPIWLPPHFSRGFIQYALASTHHCRCHFLVLKHFCFNAESHSYMPANLRLDFSWTE